MLVLQGGGALGAYQAGVYERLMQADLAPDWLAGISIGAINAALIAGNAPAERVPRLREFWDTVSSALQGPLFRQEPAQEALRRFAGACSAGYALSFGLPGFFAPRVPPAPFNWPGTPAALSYYDTAPLRATLERLVDFERINRGAPRLCVGAVNVRTGNFRYFDSAREPIRVEHIMASGALPPGFPPVEIEGELYWDGGIVSNTPLQYVLEQPLERDLLVFQVDLFSAHGPVPRNLADVAEREKDIRYSSRTRHNVDLLGQQHAVRHATLELIERLPARLREDPEVRRLADASAEHAVTIALLIHRRKQSDTQSKDYEFSRQTVREHWRMGSEDLQHTFASRAWRERVRPEDGVLVIDAAHDDGRKSRQVSAEKGIH